MEVPPGYEGVANYVCRLKNALYGLKHSPRAWFGRLTKVMIALGYHTLFIKHSTSRRMTILLVYVDDIIVTSDDWKEQRLLSQHLEKEFEMKTLGRLKYFLGIEVSHSKKGIFIFRQKYVTNLLKETCMIASLSTLMDSNIKLAN